MSIDPAAGDVSPANIILDCRFQIQDWRAGRLSAGLRFL